MTGVAVARDTVRVRASYFFLSYAHSPPLAGPPQPPPDRWVLTFFRDLTDAVRGLGSQRGIAPGFIDQVIQPGSDLRASLAHALSTAEVFVPLYSPGYFARSWPGREWACFERGLIDAGVENPISRFAPVLWIPLQPGQEPAGLAQAIALGEGERAYAENGLRALLRLAPYRKPYERIVARLAAHVVDLAENAPITPSAAPDIDEVQSPFSLAIAAAVFAVAVAAPARSGMPAGGDPAAYGSTGTAWRPFGSQELSLAEYAATAAEQLDFAVTVADLDAAEGHLGTIPGVVLIDPRYAADAINLDALSRAVTSRPWILPVVVLSSSGDPREAELVHRIRDLLDKSQPARTDMARQAVAGVESLEQFVALMPFLIAEAERQYLRHGPVARSTVRLGSRPRLRDGEWGGPAVSEEDHDD